MKWNNFQVLRLLIISCMLLNLTFCYGDVKPPKANPYKEEKEVRHSLFREKDSIERMSAYSVGVPTPRGESNSKGNKQLPDAEKIIAMRVVEHYKKMFDYLDYKPVDDLLTAEELSEAFKDFQWPKANPEITDDLEYAKMIIQQYDKNNKNSINFLEFCKFMEDLWNSADMLQEQKCNVAFGKSKEIFVRLFHWLDRDHDNMITPEDMIYGISRIMIRDVDIKEIQDVFALYDVKKVGKIDLDTFILAIINGKLDKTFKDEMFTTNFIK